jgi:hypothetical protein
LNINLNINNGRKDSPLNINLNINNGRKDSKICTGVYGIMGGERVNEGD